MFHLDLFRIRAFTAGNIAALLAALGRGGLQFILIIWLQGIWLPQHGYSFERTPLWAGIYLLPLTIGFLASAPDLRNPLRPLRGPSLRDRRHAAGGLQLPVPAADTGQLQLLGLRGDPGPGRRRNGPVLLAQPGRDHEQHPDQTARRGLGHGRDLPELGDGPVDRHLLHPDDPGTGQHAERGVEPRPYGAGGIGRRRGPDLSPAAGGDPLRLAARLQPDPAATRALGTSPERRSPAVPDRARLLPAPHLRAFPRRAAGGVPLLDRGLSDRCRSLVAARREVRLRRGRRGVPLAGVRG